MPFHLIAAAAEKAGKKDVKRFLADGDEDLEFERSGAEDEFVPEIDPEPAASSKIQKKTMVRFQTLPLLV